MTNFTETLQVPSIKTEFDPEFPGWTWSFYSQCDRAEATSLECFGSEEDAIADGLEAWERDRQQRIAWTIMENALSSARAMGVSNYNLLQGLGWLCHKTPELRKATKHVEEAAYAIEEMVPLLVEDVQEIARRALNS